MKTIEQLRAADALTRVRKLAELPDPDKRRYRAYVERLGPAIVMNGLGQALATEWAGADERSKKVEERAHFQLFSSLKGWLCRKPGGVYAGASDLLGAILDHEESRYLHAQAEALAWLEWHKKFCRAQFPKGDD